VAFVRADRIWETTITNGQGALTLLGAVTDYRSFGAACANADTILYFVVNKANTAEWEQGLGTWGTGGLLTRTTVYAGSAGAGVKVNFTAGEKDVFSGQPASTTLSIGATVPGATATRLPYIGTGGVLSDSANLTYDETSGPRLTVGSGSGTSQGLVVGNLENGGSGIVATGLTVSSDYALKQYSTGQTVLNTKSGTSMEHRVGNTAVLTIGGSLITAAQKLSLSASGLGMATNTSALFEVGGRTILNGNSQAELQVAGTAVLTAAASSITAAQQLLFTTRGRIGPPAWDTSYFSFGNATLADTAANSALAQSSGGDTIVNAASGKSVALRVANGTTLLGIAAAAVSVNANFIFTTDNTNDLGATGATRPRSIYVGTALQIEADDGLRLTNQTDYAAAQVGTLTNAPTAGNPAKWFPIFINGTRYKVPAWA
jgi:hypothetical protein